MLTVTIEPSLFAPPSGSPDPAAFRNYVSTLLHWKTILDEGSAQILTCRATNDALIRCNCYPFRPRLRTLLSQTAVTEFDANTIAIVAEMLIARSGQLERSTGIEDILLAEDLGIIPNVFAECCWPELKYEGEKCAVVVAIARTASDDPTASAQGLAIRPAPVSQKITVDCRIEVIDSRRSDLRNLPMSPSRFRGEAIICQTFQEFLGAVDELELWKSARSNHDLETAIRVAIYKSRVAAGAATTWTMIPRFRINQQFYGTAHECGALTSDSLGRSTLRSILDAVEDRRLASVHELRTGSGPQDPQKRRGSDLAWRRNITYEHHLHYWQCEGGMKEFSCMVPHNSFDIFS
jgi:hypothetical protein